MYSKEFIAKMFNPELRHLDNSEIEIIEVRSLRPNKGKNMNNVTTNEPVEQVNQNFYIDAEGNRIEIPFDVSNDGQTYSGSETTSEETAFIAEDGADHPVTVH